MPVLAEQQRGGKGEQWQEVRRAPHAPRTWCRACPHRPPHGGLLAASYLCTGLAMSRRRQEPSTDNVRADCSWAIEVSI